MFGILLETAISGTTVSQNDINSALTNHNKVIINYHSEGEEIASGARVIGVFAYGLTKSSNPVIRAFEYYGDSRSQVIPGWKFFRLDRITYWKETNQKIYEPPTDYPAMGEFNPNGDNSMSIVYSVANYKDSDREPNNGAFQTDTEKLLAKRRDVIRNEFDNEINIKDIKDGDNFIDFSDPNNRELTSGEMNTNDGNKTEIFKTDYEKWLDHLKQQRINRTMNYGNDEVQNPDDDPIDNGIDDEAPVVTKQELEDTFKPEGEMDARDKLNGLLDRVKNAKKIDLSQFRK